MKQIALIGAHGFVGSALLTELQKNRALQVRAVTRENYTVWKKRGYDIVINAAMPSGRFFAKNNPEKDFIETVQKTADIVYGWKYKKLIQISTISARTEQESIYGKHKKAAEILCNDKNNLIIRLSALYGETLTKGALIDILNKKKVYLDKKSRYSFMNLSFVCQWIGKNLDKTGVQELGAKNTISLEEIVKHFNLKISFEGRLDIQEIQNPLPDFPNAKEVLGFLQEKINERKELLT